jgi:hypothetical protein
MTIKYTKEIKWDRHDVKRRSKRKSIDVEDEKCNSYAIRSSFKNNYAETGNLQETVDAISTRVYYCSGKQ